MKDLNLSTLINVVAAGSLLVSTTGCNTYKRAAKKGCKAMQECMPKYFNEYFGTLDVCIREAEADLEYTELNYGEACAKAQAKFAICTGKEFKKSCNQNQANKECVEQYAKVIVECAYNYYDYDYDE